MDIFQQWLLLKIQEQFGSGSTPLETDISLESILAMLRPLFEQEGALLDEEDIQKQLNSLISNGYLNNENRNYQLTLRAIVYAQTIPVISQTVQEEIQIYLKKHWWKIAGAAFLLMVLTSALTVLIFINAAGR